MGSPFPSLTKTFHSTDYDALNPTRPALSAAGKNIIITGGGTGIGAATALRFAQAGASSINIIGRRSSRLETTKSHIGSVVPDAKIYTYVTDVTNKDSVNTTFKAIHDCVGKTHVLVSNAGYITSPTSIKDADDEEWWRCFEVNIKGAFLTAQAFLQIKAEDAVLIYVSSGLSHLSVGINKSAYAASKEGAVRFFTALQVEHPEIRVTCLHPGTIKTESLKKAGHSGKGDDGKPCTMLDLRSRLAKLEQSPFQLVPCCGLRVPKLGF